jgi:hypothetical protein
MSIVTVHYEHGTLKLIISLHFFAAVLLLISRLCAVSPGYLVLFS